MMRVAAAAAAVALLWAGGVCEPLSAPDYEGCAPADAARAAADSPPVFIGSSSIARWAALAKDVDAAAVRCGFWGQQTADMIPRAKPIALRYRPKRIFYYAGDNDLADEKNPKTPDDVLTNFALFVKEIRSDPATAAVPITFLSIKECPARWSLRQKILETNLKVCRYAVADEHLDFIDVFDSLLAPDGRPSEALFEADGLHLNEKGYVEWGKRIRPWISPDRRAVSTYGCGWSHPNGLNLNRSLDR